VQHATFRLQQLNQLNNGVAGGGIAYSLKKAHNYQDKNVAQSPDSVAANFIGAAAKRLLPGVGYELAPGKNRKSAVSPLLIEISVHFVLTGIFWLKKIREFRKSRNLFINFKEASNFNCV
jgi:hypothetical protein